MTFPQTMWSHPLLVPIDARGRAELEGAGRIRTLARGERLFGSGDPAGALYVVLAGEVVIRAGTGRAEASRRRAHVGELVGEEAVARAHASRRSEAKCESAGEVAELPAPLLRRVLGRGGENEITARARRWLVRSLAADTLGAADFASDLPERERDLLLDAGRPVELRRGDLLFRQDDADDETFFLAEGILQLAREDVGRSRIVAYHGAGDLVGEARGPRTCSAVATSDAWLFAVPSSVFEEIAERHPRALARARRVRSASEAVQHEVQANATRHVLSDLARFETSRSLLAIDQDACLRCGHCSWSCASVHEDGVSRLLRRGDVVVATLTAERRSLLLPSSCQHCKNPACMIDCPTGAIGRDEHGEVYIREELCTGCGSCAKACPWDNIQIVPRQSHGKRQLPLANESAVASPKLSEAIAVKCDLCREQSPDGEPDPACVRACPTGAIFRVDPTVAFDEVRAVLGRAPSRTETQVAERAPWQAATLAFALLAAIGAYGASTALTRRTSGELLLGCVVLLFAYSGIKRWGLQVPRRARSAFAARPHFLFHIALGCTSLGIALAHMRALTSGLGLSFLGASAFGFCAATISLVAPRRLTALERTSLLPEEIGARMRDLEARVFRDLTGKSDLLKGLYGRILRPFARSPQVVLMMLARGTQRSVRDALLARIGARIPLGDERLAGLDGLVSLVVERQALRAQRVWLGLLRGSGFMHVVLAIGMTLVVLVHVSVELRR